MEDNTTINHSTTPDGSNWATGPAARTHCGTYRAFRLEILFYCFFCRVAERNYAKYKVLHIINGATES